MELDHSLGDSKNPGGPRKLHRCVDLDHLNLGPRSLHPLPASCSLRQIFSTLWGDWGSGFGYPADSYYRAERSGVQLEKGQEEREGWGEGVSPHSCPQESSEKCLLALLWGMSLASYCEHDDNLMAMDVSAVWPNLTYPNL